MFRPSYELITNYAKLLCLIVIFLSDLSAIMKSSGYGFCPTWIALPVDFHVSNQALVTSLMKTYDIIGLVFSCQEQVMMLDDDDSLIADTR